jgi:hypothetical protein
MVSRPHLSSIARIAALLAMTRADNASGRRRFGFLSTWVGRRPVWNSQQAMRLFFGEP